MKAWRKHNMQCAAKVQEMEKELDYYKRLQKQQSETKESDWLGAIIKHIETKVRETKGFRLRNKFERRTHFQAEVHFPSELLLKLFDRVGLPTPMITP